MASRLQDVILRGLASARPVATTVAAGTLYYSTDVPTTDRSNGSAWETYADTGAAGATVFSAVAQGRLTLESGVPVSTSDQTAKTTIYFTPYYGNHISIYSGTAWVDFAFTERSLALGTLVSGKNYDVFIYSSAGTPTLEFSAAWTNDTTRADALVLQDGVYVKSGATTRRYLGTFRTTSTTTTEDSIVNRFVFNAINRVPRRMSAVDTTDSWTYSTAAFRQANANTANQLNYVAGLIDTYVEVTVLAGVSTSVITSRANVGVGVNSTTVNSAPIRIAFAWASSSTTNPASAHFRGYSGSIGYQFLAWLETGIGSGTQTWYGDNGVTEPQSGIIGEVIS